MHPNGIDCINQGYYPGAFKTCNKKSTKYEQGEMEYNYSKVHTCLKMVKVLLDLKESRMHIVVIE